MVKVMLALGLVFMAGAAEANGSMGREPSIIIVHPSAAHQAIGEARRALKEQRRQDRAAIREVERAEKQAEKDAVREQRRRDAAADKAYEKKLASQRKKRGF